jgi:hypothetical protein
MDFYIKLFNVSVFRLSIDESIQGSMSLNTQEFSKEVKTRVGVTNWGYNREATLIIRQWLSPQEAVLVLNAMSDVDELRFWHLRFTVRGYQPTPQIEPSQPSLLHEKIPCSELRECYPKLKIDIQQVEVASLYDVPDDLWRMECIGTFLTLKIHFRSNRSRPIFVRQFRATVRVGEKAYAVNARTGDLHTKIQKVKGEIVPSLSGEKLTNLNSGVFPLVIESEQDFDGWLQFVFEGQPPVSLNGGNGRLMVVDLSGEEHSQEFAVIYEP